jgi:glucan phosphoethanolaminetransferase (alkaline phosphatase superfamily)
VVNNKQDRPTGAHRSPNAKPWKTALFLLLKLSAVFALVTFTNPDVPDRLHLLLQNSRIETLVPYVMIWGISLLAILVLVLQQNPLLRWGAALILALSTAIHFGYRHASLSELGVYDMVSLWTSRHEAGRAMAQYLPHVLAAVAVFATATLVFGFGRFALGQFTEKWLPRLLWLPLLPVALISGIVWMKSGGGAQAMPSQFAPYSLALVTASSLMNQEITPRKDVAWTPNPALRQDKIVMMVDESIRPEFLDTTPGNKMTPGIASVSDKLIDYGHAVSGGNCSHYSNSILRFMVDRDNIVQSANTSPMVWDFARKAGYRTVFIDGQAGNIRDASALQNFMTLGETRKIDSFHALKNIESWEADEQVMKIVAEELAKPGPVFIYANKNGAHFPYDMSYPATAAKYRPTVTETGVADSTTFANSYLNAISWSVDRLFPALVASLEANNAAMIYTSDHGQFVEPIGLTHCQTIPADPRTGLVPMMLHLPSGPLHDQYAAAAPAMKNKANHFMIAPTLLKLMGYDNKDITSVYEESLLQPDSRKPAFTTGDIFGLFSKDALWVDIDPEKSILEPEAQRIMSNISTTATTN